MTAARHLAVLCSLVQGAVLADEESNEAGPIPALESKLYTRWAPSDPVEIYYAEFLLAQWVLDHSPWNAYHSGLAFVNNRTQEKALFDFTPEDTSSVMNMVLPDIAMESTLNGFLGNARFRWRDGAKTQFFNYWPESYTNFVRLGHLNGTVYKKFRHWVADYFAPKYNGFQPVEIAITTDKTSSEGGSTNDTSITAVRSHMCHDFVTDALWVLYDHGVELKAEEAIFRDHIIMYAESASAENEYFASRRGTRKMLRYLRLLELFLAEIRQQFTAARAALVANWRLGLPVYLRDEFDTYNVHLTPPFLNYCYLPLSIPPEVHNPFGSTKLCALGMKANTTNSSAPLPWGLLLAAEDRLDNPQLWISFVLVVLISAVLSGGAVKEG